MLVTDQPEFRFFVWRQLRARPEPAAPAYVVRDKKVWVYGSFMTNMYVRNYPLMSWAFDSAEDLLHFGFTEVPQDMVKLLPGDRELMVLRDDVLELIT